MRGGNGQGAEQEVPDWTAKHDLTMQHEPATPRVSASGEVLAPPKHEGSASRRAPIHDLGAQLVEARSADALWRLERKAQLMRRIDRIGRWGSRAESGLRIGTTVLIVGAVLGIVLTLSLMVGSTPAGRAARAFMSEWLNWLMVVNLGFLGIGMVTHRLQEYCRRCGEREGIELD